MTENEPLRIGGLLLAAGGSRRMGVPKQLIEFEGSTLIKRAAATLESSGCDPTVVVLGAEADACREELSGMDINICVNPDWGSGMSSSINAGFRNLLETDPDISAVIVTLCDQPYVTSKVIDRFITEYYRIRPPMIASKYNRISGVPALFSREMFDEIFKLKGDEGARRLIRMAGDRVLRLSVPRAAFDIDSHEDLRSSRGADK